MGTLTRLLSIRIKILTVRLLDFPAYLRQSGQGSGYPREPLQFLGIWSIGPTETLTAAGSPPRLHSRKCNWAGTAATMAPPKGHPSDPGGRDTGQTLSWKTGLAGRQSCCSFVSLLDFLGLQDSLSFTLLLLPLTFIAIWQLSPSLPWLLCCFLSDRNFLSDIFSCLISP